MLMCTILLICIMCVFTYMWGEGSAIETPKNRMDPLLFRWPLFKVAYEHKQL